MIQANILTIGLLGQFSRIITEIESHSNRPVHRWIHVYSNILLKTLFPDNSFSTITD
jgi:hypothetical protein